MNKRLDRYSPTVVQSEYYSDFMNNLDLNPITGILAKVSNEDSIKQALKNLILTRRTERPYQPFIGSRITSLLFEPIDSVTINSIKNEIEETIRNNEPRVSLNEVVVTPDETNNSYNVSIYFSIINISTEPEILNLILKRVR